MYDLIKASLWLLQSSTSKGLSKIQEGTEQLSVKVNVNHTCVSFLLKLLGHKALSYANSALLIPYGDV